MRNGHGKHFEIHINEFFASIITIQLTNQLFEWISVEEAP